MLAPISVHIIWNDISCAIISSATTTFVAPGSTNNEWLKTQLLLGSSFLVYQADLTFIDLWEIWMWWFIRHQELGHLKLRQSN